MNSLALDLVALVLLSTLVNLPPTNGFYAQPNVIFITGQPADAVVCSGCGLLMSCDIPNQETTADLPRPSITWLLNGTEISELIPASQVLNSSIAGFTESTLNVPSLLPEHSGRFQCQVVDGNHSSTCDSHSIPCVPTVTISREINIQVISSPAPSEQVVLRGCGSSSVLTCRSRLLPAAVSPVLTWWRNGTAVQQDSGTQGANLLESGDLLVYHTGGDEDDIITYECVGTFPTHNHYNATIVQYTVTMTTENVSSFDSASVAVQSSHSTPSLLEWTTLELVCTLQNSSCPHSILWTLDGTELEPDLVLMGGRVLVMRDVAREGGGAYCCEAVMVGGVEGEGVRGCLDIHIEDSAAPPLLSFPHNGSTLFLNREPSASAPAAEGGSTNTTNTSSVTVFTLDILCSDPPPPSSTLTTIAWYHNGVILFNQTDSILHLRGTNPAQLYGVYQCFVTSQAGESDSITTRVLPRGLTNPPGQPNATELPRPHVDRWAALDIFWQPPLYTADLSPQQLSYHAYINRQVLRDEGTNNPATFSTNYFLYYYPSFTGIFVYVQVVGESVDDGAAVLSNASEPSAEFFKFNGFERCRNEVVFPPNVSLDCTGVLSPSVTLTDAPINAEVYHGSYDDYRRAFYVDALCTHTNGTRIHIIRGYVDSERDLPLAVSPLSFADLEVGTHCSIVSAATLQLLEAYGEEPLPLGGPTVPDDEHCFDPWLLQYSPEYTCIITAVVGLQHSQYLVSENSSTVEVCATTQGLGFTLHIATADSTADSTAEAGRDYSFTSVEWNVSSPTVGTFCVQIPILEDLILEDTETFLVTLSSEDSNVLFNECTSQIIIADNDFVEVAMNEAEMTVGEGQGSVDVCASVVGHLERNISVNFTTYHGTALENEDFNCSSATLVFTPALSEVCLPVFIVGDSALEETFESFTVALSLPEESSVRLLTTTTLVNIMDDDNVTLGFNSEHYTIHKPMLTADICIVLSGRLERSISMLFSSEPELASITTLLTLAPADFEQALYCFCINVSGEVFPPQTKGFILTLWASETGGVTFGRSSAYVQLIFADFPGNGPLAAGLGIVGGVVFVAGVLVVVAVLLRLCIQRRKKRTGKFMMYPDSESHYSMSSMFPELTDNFDRCSVTSERSHIHPMEHPSPTQAAESCNANTDQDTKEHLQMAASNPLATQPLLFNSGGILTEQRSSHDEPSRKVSKESDESKSYVHPYDTTGLCKCYQCSQRTHRTSGNSVSSSAYKASSRKISDDRMPVVSPVTSEKLIVGDSQRVPEKIPSQDAYDMPEAVDELQVTSHSCADIGGRKYSPQCENIRPVSEPISATAEVADSLAATANGVDLLTPPATAGNSMRSNDGEVGTVSDDKLLQERSRAIEMQHTSITVDMPIVPVNRDETTTSSVDHKYANWPQTTSPSATISGQHQRGLSNEPTAEHYRDGNINSAALNSLSQDGEVCSHLPGTLAKEEAASESTAVDCVLVANEGSAAGISTDHWQLLSNDQKTAPLSAEMSLVSEIFRTLETNAKCDNSKAPLVDTCDTDQEHCKRTNVASKEDSLIISDNETSNTKSVSEKRDLSYTVGVPTFPIDNRDKRHYYGDTQSPNKLNKEAFLLNTKDSRAVDAT